MHDVGKFHYREAGGDDKASKYMIYVSTGTTGQYHEIWNWFISSKDMSITANTC